MLLYNEEEVFYAKTEFTNIKITLSLAKLYMVRLRLVSNGLIFPDVVSVDIHLVTFCYYSMLVN